MALFIKKGVLIMMLSDETEIIEHVMEKYKKENKELDASFFDFDVTGDVATLLLCYSAVLYLTDIDKTGDRILRLKDAVKFSSGGNMKTRGVRKTIRTDESTRKAYSGNYKDFLLRFKGKESETGIYRMVDVEIDGYLATGEQIEFIF